MRTFCFARVFVRCKHRPQRHTSIPVCGVRARVRGGMTYVIQYIADGGCSPHCALCTAFWLLAAGGGAFAPPQLLPVRYDVRTGDVVGNGVLYWENGPPTSLPTQAPERSRVVAHRANGKEEGGKRRKVGESGGKN